MSIKMANAIIRKVKIDEWQLLKELRNKAIIECPTYFSIDYIENTSITDDKWQELVNYADKEYNQFLLFIEDNKKVVGMAGGVWDNSIKLKHTGSLIWLYIMPEFRGKGYATALINEVINRLKEKNKQKIKLLVSSNNDCAISLYKKLGFAKAGTLKNEIKFDDNYYDEDLMEKPI